MIWLAWGIILLVLAAIWVVVLQEDRRAERSRPPMGWLRRFWARPAKDRRRHPRYRATIPLTYRVMHAGVATESQTRDLSVGGIGLMVYEKFPVGTVLELTLRADPPRGPMTVQGVVQWVREAPPKTGDPKRLFWAGVQITQTGPGRLDQLRAVLEQIAPDGHPPS